MYLECGFNGGCTLIILDQRQIVPRSVQQLDILVWFTTYLSGKSCLIVSCLVLVSCLELLWRDASETNSAFALCLLS